MANATLNQSGIATTFHLASHECLLKFYLWSVVPHEAAPRKYINAVENWPARHLRIEINLQRKSHRTRRR